MADLPPSEPWIARTTHPLEDNPELCLASRQYLLELTSGQNPRALDAIGDRLTSLDSASPRQITLRRWMPRVLLALATILTLALGIPTVINAIALRDYLEDMSGFSPGAERLHNEYKNSLSAGDRFFVWGDPDAPNAELAKRALWQSEPDNPAFFADYAEEVLQHSSLPPNFLETAQRIDPGNAYFLLLAAAESGDGAVELDRGGPPRRSRSGRRRSRTRSSTPPPAPAPPSTTPSVSPTPPSGPTRRWIINSPPRFEKAVAFLHQAAALPEHRSYRQELLVERLTVLPLAHDFQSRTFRLAFAASQGGRGAFRYFALSNVIEAQAAELARKGARDELTGLVRAWRKIAHWVVEDQELFISQLVAEAFIRRSSEALLEACRSAGLDREAAELEPVWTAADRIYQDRKARNTESSGPSTLGAHGSYYAALYADSVTARMGIETPVEDLRPGRLMNFALIERAAAWLTILAALVVMGAVAQFPFNRGLLARRLSIRFAQLIRARDWLWIFGLGFVLPLLWYLAITRLTPLGCRDYSPLWGYGAPFREQLIATGLLIIAALCQATRIRLALRGRPLWSVRPPHWGWFGPACFALAIPVFGMIRYARTDLPLHAGLALGGLGLAWLFLLAGRALFGRHHRIAARAAVARVLAPAYAILILILLSILIPFLTLQERSWTARDDFMRLGADTLGASKAEHRTALALRARLREILAGGEDPTEKAADTPRP